MKKKFKKKPHWNCTDFFFRFLNIKKREAIINEYKKCCKKHVVKAKRILCER